MIRQMEELQEDIDKHKEKFDAELSAEQCRQGDLPGTAHHQGHLWKANAPNANELHAEGIRPFVRAILAGRK